MPLVAGCGQLEGRDGYVLATVQRGLTKKSRLGLFVSRDCSKQRQSAQDRPSARSESPPTTAALQLTSVQGFDLAVCFGLPVPTRKVASESCLVPDGQRKPFVSLVLPASPIQRGPTQPWRLVYPPAAISGERILCQSPYAFPFEPLMARSDG